MSGIFIEQTSIGNPIGNLYRRLHVLILVVDKDGNFMLGTKEDFYPSHIARLLGGGIKAGEEPTVAAKREIEEELKIDLPLDSFAQLCSIVTKASTNEGEMEMRTWIFAVRLPDAAIIEPSDDISGIQMYSPEGYSALIDAMRKLTGEFKAEDYSFLWSDWGKVYAPIHQHALDAYNKLTGEAHRSAATSG